MKKNRDKVKGTISLDELLKPIKKKSSFFTLDFRTKNLYNLVSMMTRFLKIWSVR